MPKKNKGSGIYSNTTGSKSNETIPTSVKRNKFPELSYGGSMADDSLEYSDRLSNNRSNGLRRQSPNRPY